MSRKAKAASISILSNTLLILMKLAVGAMSGSVSIISEAIHSTMDLIAAIIAFFSVKYADRPPDEDHPYGHDKIENISGVIEALLIVGASFMIITEAVKKITENEKIGSIGIGFAVMFISSGVNFMVSKYLYKVAKEEHSVAIEADALHLKTDVYTSFGVGAGLLLISVTGLNFLDPVIAVIIAVMILKEAYGMLINAFSPLLDVKLADEEICVIKNAIESHKDVYMDYHELRTRRSGRMKHIDLHITVCSDMSVKEAHDLCDVIEKEIEEKLKYSKVLIHVEPCSDGCGSC